MSIARPTSIAHLLVQRAMQAPAGIAYRFWHEATVSSQINNSELLHRCASLAQSIQHRSQAGDRVALVLDPGPDYVCAFFACLYAGRIAVPAYPPRGNRHGERVRALVEDAGCTLLLASPAYAERVARSLGGLSRDCQIVLVDATDDATADATAKASSLQASSSCPAGMPHSDDVALLQYTSGSTARPKGVVLRHRHLLANLDMLKQVLQPGTDAAGVSWLPPYHDMGLIGGLLLPLYCGFPVTLIAPAHFLQSPASWLQAISATRASISPSPNFGYQHCVDRVSEDALSGLDLSCWRHALNGAEMIRAATLARFAARFAACGFSHHAFFPCYGLAEATLLVTGKSVADSSFAQVAKPGAPAGVQAVGCGYPAPGVEIRIAPHADHPGHSDHPGAGGEVLLRSPALADGYWDREQGRAKPFADETGAGDGWLHTGDLGLLVDVELFITGRAKEMIILRGRNLFPTDVEAVAEAASPHLAPGGVAAFALEWEEQERLCIVAEVEHRSGIDYDAVAQALCAAVGREFEVAVHELRLIRKGTLPRTSSGKTQRLLCRRLWQAGELREIWRGIPGQADASAGKKDAPAVAAQAFDSPRGQDAAPDASEAVLLQAWQKVFERPCQMNDDFFALGGDSLKCMELVLAAREHGLELQYEDVYNHPTPRLLAAHARQAPAAGLPPLLPGQAPDYTAPLPLAPQQRRYWHDYQLDLQGPTWSHIYRELPLPIALDADLLAGILNQLVLRHPALALGFERAPSGEVLQRRHLSPPVPLEQHDLRGLPEEAAAAAQARLALETARRPFDLARPPLFRVVSVLREEADRTHGGQHRQYLLFCFHHLVCDAQSLLLLQQDLMALLQGAPLTATEGLPSYLDYMHWLQSSYGGSPRWQADRRYWMEQLHGARHRRFLPVLGGAELGNHAGRNMQWRIPAEVLERARSYCRQQNLSLFALALAALALRISEDSSQEDIVIGSPAAGREMPALQNMLGLFINLVMLRLRIEPDDNLSSVARQAQSAIVCALSHQLYQLDDITRDLRLPLLHDRFPFTTTFFSAIHFQEPCPLPHGQPPRVFDLPTDVRFEFMAYLLEYPDGVVLDLKYRKALFRDEFMQSIGDDLLARMNGPQE